MRNFYKFLLTGLLLAGSIADSQAVPAKRGVRSFLQPDGSTVEVTLQGDESFHYYLTADGLPLIEENNALYFARLENGSVSRSAFLACDKAKRTPEIIQAASAADPQTVISAMRQRSRKSVRRAIPQEGIGRFETTFLNKGQVKALVILVEYKDVKFTTANPHGYFSDLLNKDGFSEYGATGCARQFFLDSSHQYVDLVESYTTGAGASWPGPRNVTEYTFSGSPSFADWKGNDLGLPVTGISEEDGKIYFDVDGGDFVLGVPGNVSVSEITPISAKISWNRVERAKGYRVSVYTTDGRVNDYVPGYKNREITAGELTVTVSGLDAETDYFVEVSAFSGTRSSEVAPASFATAVMSFPYITPAVLPAENIKNESFVARWEPVDDADYYLLNVEGAFEVKPTTEICNFGSLIFRVPSGWDYSLKTSRYTDPNWCGKAVPSAKMDKDGATLTSPVFEHDILSCGFWTKLSSNKTESSLIIDGLVDGKWQTIQTFEELPTVGNNSVIDNIPAGTRQLRFTYLRSGQAALALDDIEIEIGGITRRQLDAYKDLNVGNVTSYTVTGLPAGETGFYYTVVALNSDGQRTLSSREQYVAVETSGIETIAPDNPSVPDLKITASGNTVACSGAPGLYLISSPSSTVKARL